MIWGDINPFHKEDVNYANAKLYKSADFGISPVPLDPNEGNQKDEAETPALPYKVIHVVNSYVNEEKVSQSMQSKVLFKYTPRDKRKVGRKALTPVREITDSLVTSYTFRL